MISHSGYDIFFDTNNQEISTEINNELTLCISDKILKIGGIFKFPLDPSLSILFDFEDKLIEFLRHFKDKKSYPGSLQALLIGNLTGNPLLVSDQVVGVLKKYNLRISKIRIYPVPLKIKFFQDENEFRILKDKSNVDPKCNPNEHSKNISNNIATNKPPEDNELEKHRRQGRGIKYKVLVVEDSISIQKILTNLINKSDCLEVVGVANNPIEAESLRKRINPDLMTLDVHMPLKDGITYFSELSRISEMPVIIVSDLSLKEASPIMRALELGAFDYIQKPSLKDMQNLDFRLVQILKEAGESIAKKKKLSKSLPKRKSSVAVEFHSELLCIGASTGGTNALREVFKSFPAQTPPILVVQHMPAAFTKVFSQSLSKISKVEVKEAEDGDILIPNRALVAPGGLQMKIIANEDEKLVVKLTDDPPLNRFKPSVDYLFNSIAELKIGSRASAALLTGMGDDGASGLLRLKEKGAYTIAQNEESCVVFGMPKAAIERNAAIEILDLTEIAKYLISSGS